MKKSTSDSNKMIIPLISIWLLGALTVLLVPAPREWGAFGHWVSPYYNRVRYVLEPSVHIILMAMITVLLMHFFKYRSRMRAFVYTLGLGLFLAGTLEGLQSFLPAEFARKCDLLDLIPSSIGILTGCLIGLYIRAVRKRRLSLERT
jgi:VanZ family protein